MNPKIQEAAERIALKVLDGLEDHTDGFYLLDSVHIPPVKRAIAAELEKLLPPLCICGHPKVNHGEGMEPLCLWESCTCEGWEPFDPPEPKR